MAGVFIELKLEDGVGSVAGDVRHKRVTIGRVGLHRVGPGRRSQPFDGWVPNRSISANRMHPNMGALVIGR